MCIHFAALVATESIERGFLSFQGNGQYLEHRLVGCDELRCRGVHLWAAQSETKTSSWSTRLLWGDASFCFRGHCAMHAGSTGIQFGFSVLSAPAASRDAAGQAPFSAGSSSRGRRRRVAHTRNTHRCSWTIFLGDRYASLASFFSQGAYDFWSQLARNTLL